RTWIVQRMGEPRQTLRFTHLFPQAGRVYTHEAEESFFSRVRFIDQGDASAFREIVTEQYVPVMSQLFEALALLDPHFRACEETFQWAIDVGDTTVQEVWEKVFCGGEGLYWIFKAAVRDDDPRAANYRAAITQIESRLSEVRAERFGNA